MTAHSIPTRQRGVTLIELMVTMAITLFLVTAAAYMYLGTRETQRAIERTSSNAETGTFALQLIGQDIMKAGYYPATVSRLSTDEPFPKLTSYPPINPTNNRASASTTDWAKSLSPGIYASGLYGCDSAQFLPSTGECDVPVAGAPDTIVINYFTNDTLAMQKESSAGDRYDCVGNDVGNDPSNNNRLNTANALAPPLQPLLVSNRYGLVATTMEIDKQTISTLSLACNGNGNNGGAAIANVYQPMLPGIEDMQFTYGVFASNGDNGTRTPDRFYTADQLSGKNGVTQLVLNTDIDNGIAVTSMSPWSRVVAVRVCIMTKSMGSSPKIADKAGAERTYLDCKDAKKTQAASDTSVRKRFVQIFPVRNLLSQVF